MHLCSWTRLVPLLATREDILTKAEFRNRKDHKIFLQKWTWRHARQMVLVTRQKFSFCSIGKARIFFWLVCTCSVRELWKENINKSIWHRKLQIQKLVYRTNVVIRYFPHWFDLHMCEELDADCIGCCHVCMVANLRTFGFNCYKSEVNLKLNLRAGKISWKRKKVKIKDLILMPEAGQM